jgi:hypothetical protein
MEILNEASATPQRVQAMLRLVALLPQPKRQDIFDCLQPASIRDNQTTSTKILNHLLQFRIVIEDAETEVLCLADDAPRDLDSADAYRRFMQRRLTGITELGVDNYLLNEVTAWYAVQNERVYTLNAEQASANFSSELYDLTDDDEIRALNSTKFNGWRNWASFLGWGVLYPAASNVGTNFVPDASERLLGVLNDLLPDQEWIVMSAFMAQLAEHCPELDGGVLFERCWQMSRPTDNRGTAMSLMLSTGLRVLQKRGCIEMKLEPDAGDLWNLFTAQGMINRISHIRRVRP